MENQSGSQAFVTLGLVMGAFLLCWFPFFLWWLLIIIIIVIIIIIIIIIVLKIAIINILLCPRYLISTICGPSCPPSPDVVVDILFWIGEYHTNSLNR